MAEKCAELLLGHRGYIVGGDVLQLGRNGKIGHPCRLSVGIVGATPLAGVTAIHAQSGTLSHPFRQRFASVFYKLARKAARGIECFTAAQSLSRAIYFASSAVTAGEAAWLIGLHGKRGYEFAKKEE